MTAGRNTFATAAVGVIAVAFLFKRLRASRRPSFPTLPPKGSPVPKGENFAEVAIVGAGPSGSVTAFYIKRQNPNLRVLMLEKETFPREKFCGEAWCTPALRILDDMGILKKLEDSGVVHDTATGGFRTPDGGGFVDMSGDRSTSKKSAARTCSIPRIVADHVICQRAQEVGAVLAEGCEVSSACFDPVTELWTITTSKDEKFFSRVLVIADGSNSFLARKMGLITSEPTGFCTRQYLKAGTHSVQADGVLYYPTDLLPGYMALFKHFNGDCYFGTYLLPGGKYGQRDLVAYHRHALQHDDLIAASVGPSVEGDEIKVAPIRIVPEKSYGDHLLIVGDAAGQVDPMTGEGIHTAMMAGKRAAEVIVEMFTKSNFSSQATKVYEWLWWSDFGFDSRFSYLGAQVITKFPWILNAMGKVAARKGKAFMIDFGEIMTGVKPKSAFLQIHLALPLGVAVVKEAFLRLILFRKWSSYLTKPYSPASGRQ